MRGGDLEFDRLNYIESTGTQYIDTGVYVGAKTSVVSDFQFTITNQQARIFGVTGSGIGEMEFVVYISSGNVFSWACGDSSYNWTNISADTKRHTFELNAKTKKFLIDDGKTCEYDTSNVVRNTGSVTLTLFTQKEHTGLINEGAFAQGARMYGTKIYEDDVLVRDFVPVRRVLTGEVGLLDNVSGRFFGNSGTGNFVAG